MARTIQEAEENIMLSQVQVTVLYSFIPISVIKVSITEQHWDQFDAKFNDSFLQWPDR